MFTDHILRQALQDRFGYADFRPGQLEVLRAVVDRRPTLAVMPTGAGKSLCYQLPALLLPGVTLVVSPLVALMKDQVDRLRQRGVAAACVNSAQPEGARASAERDLAEGRLNLVFAAPERFRSPSFRRALEQVSVALVAVDEAHCISEWGHAFRPDYEKLGEILARLAPPRLLALTATASPDVRADIVRALRMQDPKVEVAGFDRPNIHLEVHALATEAEKLDTLLGAVRAHGPAIVYTATRRQAAGMAEKLSRAGVGAEPYHAGLGPEERNATQERFLAGDLRVVTATNAFGLGIDKADVRLVVHTEIPRSLEAYYQEVGRAGRDGRPAIGALFFAAKDIFLQKHLVGLACPRPEAVLELWNALGRAGRPLSREELDRALPGQKTSTDRVASLAFLESIGAIERRFGPATLRLQLPGAVSPDGETPQSALVRLLGGRRGTATEAEVARALGCRTRRELTATLDGLERGQSLRRLAGRRQVTYAVSPSRSVCDEDLRRLRVRLLRDRMRLEQMVRLARTPACRRLALLGALGESYPRRRCGACDVCAGHQLVPVRSRLGELRLWQAHEAGAGA